jgi:hypothetical protein
MRAVAPRIIQFPEDFYYLSLLFSKLNDSRYLGYCIIRESVPVSGEVEAVKAHSSNSRFPSHFASLVVGASKCLAENEPDCKKHTKTRQFGIATEITDLNFYTHPWLFHPKKLSLPTLLPTIMVCMLPNRNMIRPLIMRVYGPWRARNTV